MFKHSKFIRRWRLRSTRNQMLHHGLSPRISGGTFGMSEATGGTAPDPGRLIRSLGGPDAVLSIAGDSMRVLSVEFYENAMTVSWLLSYVQAAEVKPQDAAFSAIDSRARLARPTGLRDDVGTAYRAPWGGGSGGNRWELHGRTTFTPAAPTNAHHLSVEWGESGAIVIELPSSREIDLT